jgi:hypothetical protein
MLHGRTCELNKLITKDSLDLSWKVGMCLVVSLYNSLVYNIASSGGIEPLLAGLLRLRPAKTHFHRQPSYWASRGFDRLAHKIHPNRLQNLQNNNHRYRYGLNYGQDI